MEKQADYGVTHGLDFARWLTEIAELLKKSGSGDPVAQVCFLEIAKTLERLRRYKKNLVLGTHKTMLIVNETPITSYPTAQIIAEPMARLLAGAGLWSVGIDHRIDIRNVEMFARILAHPEQARPAPEELRYVTLNPVKYLVVKVHEDAAEVAAGGRPRPRRWRRGSRSRTRRSSTRRPTSSARWTTRSRASARRTTRSRRRRARWRARSNR